MSEQAPPRVAVVTGSAQGIGRATAVRLAQDGYLLGLLDLNAAGLQDTVSAVDTVGGTAHAITTDVGSSGDVAAAIAECITELGGLDLLVCGAGLLRDAALLDMTDADWGAVLGVNLTGAFYCAREAARHMVAQRSGQIVLTSSTSAQGNPDQANYSAAKAGIEGLTKSLAQELGPFNINVNAVAPGFTVTQMTRDLAVKRGMTFDELIENASAAIPLRRVAQPEDIAAVISFLASADASYVTGQVIYANGGSRGSTARDLKI